MPYSFRLEEDKPSGAEERKKPQCSKGMLYGDRRVNSTFNFGTAILDNARKRRQRARGQRAAKKRAHAKSLATVGKAK